jgi:lysophospholipase L1-like esterase
MRPTLVLIAAASVCAGAQVYGQSGGATAPLPDSATARTPFEDEIEQFEAADKISPPRLGGVVFVGSSSIRLWPHLSADFPGVNVIQRGFGGSELWQAVKYATRIVLPYRPTRIVVYEGDNDLAAGRSPEQILKDYQDFVALVHETLPDTRIAFVAIKPSGSRLALIEQMRKTNWLVREYSATDSKLVYVDVFTPMLGRDGSPQPDLYAADSLHLSARGYEIWRRLLAPFVYGR